MNILHDSQFNVVKIPYHVHNGIDTPKVFTSYTIMTGQGNPTTIAQKGTLYIKMNASSTTDRLWVNTNGGSTWAYFTSSA